MGQFDRFEDTKRTRIQTLSGCKVKVQLVGFNETSYSFQCLSHQINPVRKERKTLPDRRKR